MADIDFEQLSEALNEKVDRDLINIENPLPESSIEQLAKILAGKIWKNLMPDYASRIAVANSFTAPADGYVMWNNNGTGNASVNGITVYIGGNDSSNEGPAMIFVNSGDSVTITPDAGNPSFIPTTYTNN